MEEKTCPHCNRLIDTVIMKWKTGGFVYYCPKCDERITKQEMMEMAELFLSSQDPYELFLDRM